ncbi:MAG: hypothetical protein IJX94_06585, partial [Clostridia bacterium]|nr:hypothetical protein [Clostridia bacterium]
PASSSTYTDCGVTTFKLYGETEQNAVTATYVGGFSGGAATYPSYTRCSANSIDLKMAGIGSENAHLVGGFTGMVRNGLDPVATFDTVTSSGTITVTGTPGRQYGGLIGIIRNNATLTDCSSSVNLIFSDGGAQNVGGLVGNVYNDVSEVTITNCDFTGSITTSSGTNVGGLVGINIGMGVTLANCEMGGTVTVTEGTNVGALVGTLTDGTVNGTLDMEGCTVTAETNYNWFGTDTKDCHITLKNGNSSVEFDTLKIRYQTKDDGAADTETFRLIATVDAYISTYEKLGFVLTDSQNQSVTLETTTVWDTIAGGGNTYVPSEAGDGQTSAGYGENSVFFFAVEQEAVSLAATFTVQAFVVQSGVTILGEAFTFCVGDLLPVQ